LPRTSSPFTTLICLTLGGAWVLQTATTPARAGLLRPLLDWMQPRLEERLSQACVQQLAADDAQLGRLVQGPCSALARPTSRCLIEETERSGRGFEVLREMWAGRFGAASESVSKRCVARQLGLPADSLDQVPLRELVHRYSEGTRR